MSYNDSTRSFKIVHIVWLFFKKEIEKSLYAEMILE